MIYIIYNELVRGVSVANTLEPFSWVRVVARYTRLLVVSVMCWGSPLVWVLCVAP